MAAPTCRPIPTLPDVTSITLPYGVTLKQLQASVYKVPDPSELLMPLLTQIQASLSPVRQFLAVVQCIVAIKQCAEALPDAISTLSPGPILNCLGGFAKAFAELVKYIPPISYAVLALDICVLLVQAIDVFFGFLEHIDEQITTIKSVANIAATSNDSELLKLTECLTYETNVMLSSSLDPLIMLQPIAEVILEAIKAFAPPSLDKEITEFQQQFVDFERDKQAFLDSASFPESLENLLGPMANIRDIMVRIYIIVAPIAGRDASVVSQKNAPTFDNF